jgi:hypothetical protein
LIFGERGDAGSENDGGRWGRKRMGEEDWENDTDSGDELREDTLEV